MDDSYLYIIVALLPLTACMLITQVNPYHALVIRGILGAVAALVYAVLGAADVALTEALVGTLLAITLYAVAVRSSLVMRLGVYQDISGSPLLSSPDFETLLSYLRERLKPYHMRLELVPYDSQQSLQQALKDRDVHAVCTQIETAAETAYQTAVRTPRLYEILQGELPVTATRLIYVNPAEAEEEAR